MKKIGYLLFAATIMTSVGCSDDTIVEKPVVPAEVGEEITFGSSLEKAGKRTVYDDTPTTGEDGHTQYYRVSWVDGDEVAIYCPQASQGTLVNYRITPAKDDPTASELVEKVNPDQAGLQWGQDDDHYFYAFYPADRVKGTEDGKIRGTVPTTQNVKSWNPVLENGGKTWYGKTQTEENAYMWAYGHFKRSGMGDAVLPLTFHPWMTVLEIVIPGPETGTKTVTNVNIRATEGTQTMIAGDFICDMTPVEADPKAVPVYRPIGNEGTVSNTISISGWVPATENEEGHFIELGPNDKMVVRAYLLPIDDVSEGNARNVQVSVATLNGAALTRTLGWAGGGDGSIQPHKVNRVTLPRLIDTGTNYWMSSLDKDIYLSELSLPGSKFSYLTSENGASAPYQGVGLDQQFLDGVRAFMVQVGVDATYHATRTGSGWNPTYTYEYESANLNVQGAPSNTTLATTIADLAQQLATAENNMPDRSLECAVLMVTALGKPESVNFTGNPPTGIWRNVTADINDVGGGWKVWIEAVTKELQKLSENSQYRIFSEEITANTTLDDVKGKIILKVNYNEASQESDVDADANYPMLFSRWDGIINDVDLRWGSPNTSSSRTALSWYYQEATHIGSGTQGSPADKWNNIKTVFDESITKYEQNDNHDTWFMNDCGGKFYGTVTGTNGYDGNYATTEAGTPDAISKFTRWINPQVTAYLQERDANASLGLVYFNFADKQSEYGSNYLVQSVIDNNFKFNLRKEGSSETPMPSTKADASFANGGSVWQ